MIERVLLFFVMFPFVQIVPLASYTQPYAVLMAGIVLLARPQCFFDLPQIDRLALGWLAVLGTLLLLVAAMQGLVFRELSFWLSYVSPLFITAACFWVIRRNPERVRKALTWAICAICVVSAVQLYIDPGFLTFLATHSAELGNNILASGRGALGFAPEPTHNGLSLIILAAALAVLGGRTWVIALAVIGALLLARSTTAAMALAFGVLAWAFMRPIRRSGLILGIFTLTGFPYLLAGVFEDNTRIGYLLSSLIERGPQILLLDASANARFSGMVMPIVYSVQNGLIPHGMSIEAWFVVHEKLLADYRWILFLSLNGPASGFGLALFQGGLLALPVIVYMAWRLIVRRAGGWDGILVASVFLAFCGQLYMATPGLGLLLAAVAWRGATPKTVARDPIQGAPVAPASAAHV